MLLKNFYTKYLRYYLDNPEKPGIRKTYFLSILVIILLNVCLASNLSGLIPDLIMGGLVSLLMLVVSFYFGYLGLMSNILFSIFGIIMTTKIWFTEKNAVSLSIVTFQSVVLAASFFISYLLEQERQKQRRLEWLTLVDGLTEAYNHRYFQQKLDQEIERIQRNNGVLGLFMIDIDNFRKFNETFGHKAGDEVLKRTTEFLKSRVGENDAVFRYGGDEFVILLDNFDKDKDIKRFESIVKSFSEQKFFIGNDQSSGSLTLSMGFSIYPDSGKNKDELLKQAESALYLAKNAGRNRIQFYRDVLEEIRRFSSTNEQQILGNLKVLLATVSVKDKYTMSHAERVANYAVIISNALGLSSEEIQANQLAGLLHDIGKIEIHESILNKKGQLSEDEMEVMKMHPVYSAIILEPLDGVNRVIPSVRYHHERYDGLGYPDGLSGESIPLGARILTVADAFDAMLSDRPYRKGMKHQEVVQQLVKCSGTQFDPRIVQVFIEAMGLSSV